MKKRCTKLMRAAAALLALAIFFTLPGCGDRVSASTPQPPAGTAPLAGTPAENGTVLQPSDPAGPPAPAPASTPAPAPTPTSEVPLAPAVEGICTPLAVAEYPKMKPYPLAQDYTSEETGLLDYDKYESAERRWQSSISRLSSGLDYSGRLDHFLTVANQEFLSSTEGENRVWSPLNVWLAMAMLAETTDGESRQQLLSLLGADSLDQLRETANALWKDNYRDDGLTGSVLANSIWLRDADDLYSQSTLDNLAQFYYASAFSGAMGTEEYNQALRNWIDEQTHDLLKDYSKNLSMDPNTLLTLASTIYFKAPWKDPFDPELTESDTFHAVSGDISADFMHQTLTHTTYYRADRFSAVALPFQEPSFKMWILLPQDGTSPEELTASSEATDFLLAASQGEWEDSCKADVVLSLPKFDISSGMDLVSGLKNLGVSDIFDSTLADFTPLTGMDGVEVGSVKHAARVIADEEKVEAAAFTVSKFMATALIISNTVYFTADRPFLFAVTGPTGLPLFLGVVQQPN